MRSRTILTNYEIALQIEQCPIQELSFEIFRRSALRTISALPAKMSGASTSP